LCDLLGRWVIRKEFWRGFREVFLGFEEFVQRKGVFVVFVVYSHFLCIMAGRERALRYGSGGESQVSTAY